MLEITMVLNPYTRQLSPTWKIKQWFIRVWPTVYGVINHIFESLVGSLREMIRSIYDAIRP